MGIDEPSVVHRQSLDKNFTFYVVYGSLTHTVNYDDIVVQSIEVDTMDMHEVDEFIKENIKRKIVVIGASTGTDAHIRGDRCYNEYERLCRTLWS